MPQVTVAKLFEDNREALKLSWAAGEAHAAEVLDSRLITQSAHGLIGHLNFYHPNWIQIFSRTEAVYFQAMDPLAQEQALARLQNSGLACIMLSDESGVGKSELALELITRGGGLVADDVVELYHVAPETLEGRSPELLKDFLEVRGLGMLNIRTIFGETAVRVRKNLKLIVQLEKPVGGVVPGLERFPLEATTEEILGVRIRKVVLP